jgi:hypothetical protein
MSEINTAQGHIRLYVGVRITYFRTSMTIAVDCYGSTLQLFSVLAFCVVHLCAMLLLHDEQGELDAIQPRSHFDQNHAETP